MSNIPEEKLDYYAILGGSFNSSKDELKKIYKEKVLKVHPDKNPDLKDAAEKFDELKKAYDFLMDDEQRAKYDEKLRVQEARKEKLAKEDSVLLSMRNRLDKAEATAKEKARTKNFVSQKALAKQETEDFIRQQQELGRLNANTTPLASKVNIVNGSGNMADKNRIVLVKWEKVDDEDSKLLTESGLKKLFETYDRVDRVLVQQRKRKAYVVLKTAEMAKEAVSAIAGTHKKLRLSVVGDDAAAVAQTAIPTSYTAMAAQQKEQSAYGTQPRPAQTALPTAPRSNSYGAQRKDSYEDDTLKRMLAMAKAKRKRIEEASASTTTSYEDDTLKRMLAMAKAKRKQTEEASASTTTKV
eukprot:g56806.t1